MSVPLRATKLLLMYRSVSRLAWKISPTLFLEESTPSIMRTSRDCPAGIVTSPYCAAGSCAGGACADGRVASPFGVMLEDEFAAGGGTSCEVMGGCEASRGGAAEAAEVSGGAAGGAGAAGGGAEAGGTEGGAAGADAFAAPLFPVNVTATASITLNVCTSPFTSNRSTACVPPRYRPCSTRPSFSSKVSAAADPTKNNPSATAAIVRPRPFIICLFPPALCRDCSFRTCVLAPLNLKS